MNQLVARLEALDTISNNDEWLRAVRLIVKYGGVRRDMNIAT